MLKVHPDPIAAQSDFLFDLSANPLESTFERPENGQIEISVGCRVKLQMDDGEELAVNLVTTDPNPDAGRISAKSPLGEALIGVLVGEDIEFTIGERTRTVHVLDVKFLQDA